MLSVKQEFNLRTEKRVPQNPPIELFSKVNLNEDVSGMLYKPSSSFFMFLVNITWHLTMQLKCLICFWLLKHIICVYINRISCFFICSASCLLPLNFSQLMDPRGCCIILPWYPWRFSLYINSCHFLSFTFEFLFILVSYCCNCSLV